MRTFECDYTEGVHPKLLEALKKTNLEQMSGYGFDPYTAKAAEKIRAACCAEDATVTFFTGGTQTNMIVLDLLLAPFEGVIAPKTGHINVHEAGAIEFTGHKVLALSESNGVLDVDVVKKSHIVSKESSATSESRLILIPSSAKSSPPFW